MRGKSFIFLSLFFLTANILAWQIIGEIREGSLRIVFFDVGQGDSVFIKTPQNHYIVIDGGPGDVVLEKLSDELPFFSRKIDLVILTHLHDDHVSGLIEIVSRYDVKDIICTGSESDTGVARKWKEVRDSSGYRVGQAGMRISGKDFHINILYPTSDLSGESVKDLNQASVIARLVYRDGTSFLLTGDAYKEQEKEILSNYKECVRKNRDDCDRFSLKSDVLKLGHHGSKTSTDETFLRAVNPRVAVISAGKDNRYGHPHREVVELIEENKILLKRTDYDSSIVFELK